MDQVGAGNQADESGPWHVRRRPDLPRVTLNHRHRTCSIPTRNATTHTHRSADERALDYLVSYRRRVLSAGVESVAEDLRQYGEDATAAWVLGCSEDELVRLCSVADWLLFNGPATPSGASMMIAKACALAAVYVREGIPRNLARSRRGAPSGIAVPSSGGRRPDYALQKAAPRDYGVGDDARAFWGTQASGT